MALDDFVGNMFEKIIKKVYPKFDWDKLPFVVNLLLLIVMMVVMVFILLGGGWLIITILGSFISMIFGVHADNVISTGLIACIILWLLYSKLFFAILSFLISYIIFGLLTPFIDNYASGNIFLNISNLFTTYYKRLFDQKDSVVISNDLLLFFVFLIFLMLGFSFWILSNKKSNDG